MQYFSLFDLIVFVLRENYMTCKPFSFRVYPYLCRAVRNFAHDRGQVPPAKEFYTSFVDVSNRIKYGYVSVSSC